MTMPASEETSQTFGPAVGAAQRNASLDIVKGIGIILVVYGHLSREVLDRGVASHPGLLETLYFCLYTFHMPLFFFIAGYNTHISICRHNRRGFLASRIWKVVYPYFLWSLLIWLPKGLMARFLAINHPFQVYDIEHIAWQPISVYWFLYVLFIMQIFALVLYRQGVFLVILTIVSDAIVFYLGLNRTHIFSMLVEHSVFFALGFAACQRKFPLTPDGLRSPIVLFSVFTVFALGCYLAVSSGVTAPVGLLTLPVSLAGIPLTIGLALACPAPFLRERLRLVGVHTFPIYVMHIFFLPLVLFAAAAMKIRSETLILLGGTMLGVYGPLAASILIKRAGLDGWFGLSGKSPIDRGAWSRATGGAAHPPPLNPPREDGTTSASIPS